MVKDVCRNQETLSALQQFSGGAYVSCVQESRIPVPTVAVTDGNMIIPPFDQYVSQLSRNRLLQNPDQDLEFICREWQTVIDVALTPTNPYKWMDSGKISGSAAAWQTEHTETARMLVNAFISKDNFEQLVRNVDSFNNAYIRFSTDKFTAVYKRKTDWCTLTRSKMAYSPIELFTEYWWSMENGSGWSTGNQISNDFDIFDNFQDAQNNTNAWTGCTWDKKSGMGFPGKCGQTSQTTGRWFGLPEVFYHATNEVIYSNDSENAAVPFAKSSRLQGWSEFRVEEMRGNFGSAKIEILVDPAATTNFTPCARRLESEDLSSMSEDVPSIAAEDLFV
jgi:hypothetical protein